MKKKKYTNNCFLAFTLAEVLITLGIIGVVAAMTIPTLINNYQKTTYVKALQKAYSEAVQVLKQISQDYGCVDDIKCTGLMATGTSHQTFGSIVVKYFKVSKDCQTVVNLDCWAASTNQNYDGSSGTNYVFGSASFGYYNFITLDGMSIAIQNLANDCGNNWSSGQTADMTQTCGQIAVDVNGPLKGPNFLGRDTFYFWITNGNGLKLYPRGGADDNYTGNHWWQNNYCYGTSKDGWECSGRIIEQGWQMLY